MKNKTLDRQHDFTTIYFEYSANDKTQRSKNEKQRANATYLLRVDIKPTQHPETLWISYVMPRQAFKRKKRASARSKSCSDDQLVPIALNRISDCFSAFLMSWLRRVWKGNSGIKVNRKAISYNNIKLQSHDNAGSWSQIRKRWFAKYKADRSWNKKTFDHTQTRVAFAFTSNEENRNRRMHE